MAGEEEEPNVAIDDDGNRIVSWPVQLADGPIRFQHRFPDAVQHHYKIAGPDQDVWLYRGAFSLDGDSGFTGDVRWSWRPTARIETQGTRPIGLSELADLLSREEDLELWLEPSTLEIELPDGALPPPPPAPAAEAPNQRQSVRADVQQELGNAVGLERVTFFIPNGWDGHDGQGICDPANLRQLWYGRTTASGDGWN